MSIPRTITALSLGAAVLGALAGCSGAQESPSAPKAVDTVPVGEEARDLVLPFDEYQLTTADVYTIEAAEDVLIGDCMRDKGMDWRPLPRVDDAEVEPPNRRRYGVIETGVARRYGYHLPPPTAGAAEREAAWTGREKLPAWERTAAYGEDGQSGCTARAKDRLSPKKPAFDLSGSNEYAQKAFRASRRDPEVVEVFAAWSACMEKSGFSYPDPLAATGDEQWAETPRPSAHELDVAAADLRCKESTDLVAVWADADARVQRKAIDAHAEEFADLMTAKRHWMKAAHRVVERD